MLAWRSGRSILGQRLRSKTLPFETLNDLLEKQVVQRVKGTSVYMVGQSKILPPALVANLQLNRALHERVIFLTVQTADTPIVRDGESVQIEALENNFFKIMTTNAQRAADYFYLPPFRIVELGISLDI